MVANIIMVDIIVMDITFTMGKDLEMDIIIIMDTDIIRDIVNQ